MDYPGPGEEKTVGLHVPEQIDGAEESTSEEESDGESSN